MRIVIEAMSLIPGQTGGIETYIRNLVQELARQAPDDEFVVAVGDEAAGTFCETSRNVGEWNADTRLSRLFRKQRLVRTLLQCANLARYLNRTTYDLIHCTMSFPKPPWGKFRIIVTIHDVIVPELREQWKEIKPTIATLLIKLAIKKARKVLMVSDYERRTLCAAYSVDTNRVTAVYNGVNHKVFTPGDDHSNDILTLQNEYALASGFLFFPAHTHRHKNHRRLLEALTVLDSRYGLRPTLVLTGAPAFGHAEVMQAIQDFGLTDRVRWLGHVPLQHLVALYRTAAMMVFPSLHEAFGLPIVEAMACGCPVACSNTTACGEVAGDAAITFDPTDVGAIADSIAGLLTNEARRRELIQRGIARARLFTWERCAEQTLNVYRNVT